MGSTPKTISPSFTSGKVNISFHSQNLQKEYKLTYISKLDDETKFKLEQLHAVQVIEEDDDDE